MRKLIVFYSLDGNTRFIAKVMAEAAGADMLELKPKDQPAVKGFMKYFWGGKQVFQKQKPQLETFDKNPQDYDLIFIGTPVWAFTYAPALATFFDQVKLKDKKIALFCCSGGGKGKTLSNMRDQLKGNTILGEIDFVEPLRLNVIKNEEAARDWAKKI